MATFLLQKAPPGRILNDYEYSAYLQWALHEKRELYIDLTNAYPDSLMDEYFEVIASHKNPQRMAKLDAKRAQILARRQVQVVALRPSEKTEGISILTNYLDRDANWKRIYSGNDGKVWARR